MHEKGATAQMASRKEGWHRMIKYETICTYLTLAVDANGQ